MARPKKTRFTPVVAVATLLFMIVVPECAAQREQHLLNRRNLDQINNFFLYQDMENAGTLELPRPSERFRSKIAAHETDGLVVVIDRETGEIIECKFRTECDPTLHDLPLEDSDRAILSALLLRNGKPVHKLVQFGCDFERTAALPENRRVESLAQLDRSVQRLFSVVVDSGDPALTRYVHDMVGGMAVAHYDAVAKGVGANVAPAIRESIGGLERTLAQLGRRGVPPRTRLPVVYVPRTAEKILNLQFDNIKSSPQIDQRFGGMVVNVSSDATGSQVLVINDSGIRVIRPTDRRATPNWQKMILTPGAFR